MIYFLFQDPFTHANYHSTFKWYIRIYEKGASVIAAETHSYNYV